MIQAKIIKEIVYNNKEFSMYTQGNSMFPTIKENEKVDIIKAEKLSVGDIVLFEMGNNLVLHRIVEIREPFYVTQGDNHLYSDYYINKNQIIGKLKSYYQKERDKHQYNCTFSGITFVYWKLEKLSSQLIFQLEAYGIKIKKEEIPQDKVNIAIIPGAKNNIDTLKRLIKQKGAVNIAIHFNANISNSPREGFLELDNFSECFRIGHRINNFLLTGEESMLIILGNLL